jgi:polyhydroxybutyrate depolymerase
MTTMTLLLRAGRLAAFVCLLAVAACAAPGGGTRSTAPGANVAQLPPLPTSGCGIPAADGRQTLKFQGASWRYIVDLPPGYDKSVPTRLILAFHGRTGTAEKVRTYFDLEGSAARPAIVVYPQAQGGWGGKADRDMAYVDTLLARLKATLCVDQNQIFAAGHSMGGSFVNDLSCGRAGVFRATAVVAGGIGSVRPCQGQVAAILLHNPKDNMVPYSQGITERDKRIAQNRLAATPADASATFRCKRWGKAGIADPVVFCDLPSTFNRKRPYSHGWPDGTGPTIVGFFDRVTDQRIQLTERPPAP